MPKKIFLFFLFFTITTYNLSSSGSLNYKSKNASVVISNFSAEIVIGEDGQTEKDLQMLEKMLPLLYEKKKKKKKRQIRANILDRIKKTPYGSPKQDSRNQKVLKRAIETYGAKKIELQTEDNLKISALFFKRENAPINIVLATGFFDKYTPTKEWCAPFAALYPNFNIISFDWRGFGESSGDPIRYGSNAYKDIHAVIDFIKKDNDKPVILGGYCFGAAMCMHATLKAMEENKPIADALVLNSIFTTFLDMLSRSAENEDNWFKRFLINQKWYVNYRVRKSDGNILEIKPIEMIDHLKIPCYFEHSQEDLFSPIDGGMEVYNKAEIPKIFMLSRIGGHVRTHTKLPFQHRNAFYQFLYEMNFIDNKSFETLTLEI